MFLIKTHYGNQLLSLFFDSTATEIQIWVTRITDKWTPHSSHSTTEVANDNRYAKRILIYVINQNKPAGHRLDIWLTKPRDLRPCQMKVRVALVLRCGWQDRNGDGGQPQGRTVSEEQHVFGWCGQYLKRKKSRYISLCAYGEVGLLF